MFCGHSSMQHFEDWKTQKTSYIICCEGKATSIMRFPETELYILYNCIAISSNCLAASDLQGFLKYLSKKIKKHSCFPFRK